jgi:hypothetical protein
MLREALIDLDPVVWAEVLPKRGLSKVGLRVHEARGRISKFSRHAHYGRRTVAGALPKIGRNCNRANKD